MKLNLYSYLLVCLSTVCLHAEAQSLKPAAVPLSAIISNSPAQIKLRWPRDTTSGGYQVFRKTKTASSWGSALTATFLTDTSYTDNVVTAGTAYEYKVECTKSPDHTFGYIYAGIEIPVVENRGKILVVVDTTFKADFWPEFLRLEQDMRGDGWLVNRFMVDTLTTVTTIKNYIADLYAADPVNLKSVMLFGNVAVPYSGNIYPDGHPDHTGAWPADVYYGELTGDWQDIGVNTDLNPVAYQPARSENRNLPGDGKFDVDVLSDMPENAELQIGRVDLSNLPAFSKSEGQLLKQYLDKDHNFRHRVFVAQERAVIQDNFSAYPEKFGANGWRNFAPMFSDTNVVEAPYDFTLKSGSYLWSYGSGAGTFLQAGGIDSTSNLTTDSLQGVFTMLFGSYFGDWDNKNNFLRAPLASKGLTLTNAWAGRPNWYYHHMALGDNIGYSTMVSQNNSGLYVTGIYASGVHAALMGDPTLRLHTIVPPANVTAVPNLLNVDINWTASTEAVQGYYVYRADSSNGIYSRITPTVITGTSFTHMAVAPGTPNYYMVRSVNLQNSASGSYYNQSQGIFTSAAVFTGISAKVQQGSILVYPNPASDLIHVVLNNATSGNYQLQVRDVMGRMIIEKTCKASNGNFSETVNLDSYSRGFYTISVSGKSSVFTQKLVLR